MNKYFSMCLAILFLITATCVWAAQEGPVKVLDTPAVKTKIPARATQIPQAKTLLVESVEVLPAKVYSIYDNDKCTHRVNIVLLNNTGVAIADKTHMLHLWWKSGSAGWQIFRGYALGAIAAGARHTTQADHIDWMGPDVWIRATVSKAGGNAHQPLSEKGAKIPYPDAAQLQLDPIELRADGYSVTIRNNSALNLCGFTLQTYVEQAGAPGTWKPLAGSVIPRGVPANGTGLINQSRPAGWKNGLTRFKALLYANTDVMERIVTVQP